MALTSKQRDFLFKLADLCDEYKAEFSYTNDNDGIHIDVDGVKVFAGFLSGDAGKALRAVAVQR